LATKSTESGPIESIFSPKCAAIFYNFSWNPCACTHKKETVKLSSDGSTPKNQMKTIFLPYFLLVLFLIRIAFSVVSYSHALYTHTALVGHMTVKKTFKTY
jgi:hypothetical protein